MQPTLEEIACVERVMRMAGPTATIEVQPSRVAGSGELWTVHIRRAGTLGIGQGGSLEEAFADLHAADAIAKAKAA